MDAELKRTIDELGSAVEKLRSNNDDRLKALEDRGTSDPLLTEKIDKINTEITSLGSMKTQLEALETSIARMDLNGAGAGQVSAQAKALKDHAEAFDAWFRKGGESREEALKTLEIEANLSTLDDPNGGYLTTPPEFDQAIDRVAGTLSAMRRLATVRTIGTDTFEKLVNQGGTGSGWVGEKESRDETDTPTLTKIIINTKEVYANPAATQQALDDSFLDLAAFLADEVSVEFNEQEGDAFINGDGVKKPHGLADYDTVANASYEWGKIGYIPSGKASTLESSDPLIKLQHALKPAYRGQSAWLMNDSTAEVVRLLKNGNSDYIWRPGLLEGAPDILLGKRVEYDDNVADIGTDELAVFYGNFKRTYLIIDRMGIRILRDPYTNKPFVMFYTTKRVGGGIVMYEAMKTLKIATS